MKSTMNKLIKMINNHIKADIIENSDNQLTFTKEFPLDNSFAARNIDADDFANIVLFTLAELDIKANLISFNSVSNRTYQVNVIVA